MELVLCLTSSYFSASINNIVYCMKHLRIITQYSGSSLGSYLGRNVKTLERLPLHHSKFRFSCHEILAGMSCWERDVVLNLSPKRNANPRHYLQDPAKERKKRDRDKNSLNVSNLRTCGWLFCQYTYSVILVHAYKCDQWMAAHDRYYDSTYVFMYKLITYLGRVSASYECKPKVAARTDSGNTVSTVA